MSGDKFSSDPEARRLVETLALIESANLPDQAGREIRQAVRAMHNYRLRANIEIESMVQQLGLIINVLTGASQLPEGDVSEAAVQAQEAIARTFSLRETRALLRRLYDDLDHYTLM